MAIAHVDEQGFTDLVHKGELPVVVDFYADWCGPCRQLAPIIDSLSHKYAGSVSFVKVNVDEEPQLAATYQIKTIPSVILFENGVPKGRSIGVKAPNTLARELGLDSFGDGSSTTETDEPQNAGLIRRWWANR